MPRKSGSDDWHVIAVRFKKEAVSDIDRVRRRMGDTRSNYIRRCVSFVSTQHRLGRKVGYIDESKRFVEITFS